ncbi:2OG-Fe(II) oxygenase [Glaciecola sp. XM2]|uniref:2OG-Fe(II) oxygenase n=1 Tax=Glaciecola sp. XM2 TaxID=1914931 RepID=UPI001BDF225C|nr:2OG-Fe(II) oxygenase [Glaciecola sp. XM2]
MKLSTKLKTGSGHSPSDSLFESIANDLLVRGFSIQHKALELDIADILHHHITNMPSTKFSDASIGRQQTNQLNEDVRRDEIAWINGESPAGIKWLQWTQALQSYLNRRLFLGLFSFESHFAHYGKGNFYKRHIDAFKGEANRVLSLVLYLNPQWQQGDGGELVIYENSADKQGIRVNPEYGTLAVFLSEEFEHEVLPTHTDRYSVAGWFRVNTSTGERADPPQ